MCPTCLTEMAQAMAAAVPAAAAAVYAALSVPFFKHKEATMQDPKVVTRPEWLRARKELLALEKEETRQRDAGTAAHRRLPMVELDKEYVFDGPRGPVRLADLFGGRSQLLVGHFMFDPQWEEGCKSCSHFADNYDGTVVHLAARDTSFAAVSLAPIEKIERFKARM